MGAWVPVMVCPEYSAPGGEFRFPSMFPPNGGCSGLGEGGERLPDRGIVALGLRVGPVPAHAGVDVEARLTVRPGCRSTSSRTGDHAIRHRHRLLHDGGDTQIFENLAIGDPRRPDLIARRVEVADPARLHRAPVGLITARGVRMRGRVANGRLTPRPDRPAASAALGRALPPARPADRRRRRGARARDAGRPGRAGALAGAAISPTAFAAASPSSRASCSSATACSTRPVARFSVAIVERAAAAARPGGDGAAAPAAAASRSSVRCSRFEALLEPGLDGWRGSAAVRVAALRVRAGRASPPFQGRLDLRRQRRATARPARPRAPARASAQGVRAARPRFDGRYALAPRPRRLPAHRRGSARRA